MREELEVRPAAEILAPWGEVIDLDAERERIPHLLDELRRHRGQVNECLRVLTEHVAAMSLTAGTKTLTLGGRKVSLRGDTEVHWDVDVLTELLDAGLPPDRFGELVTEEISHKVNAAVARQIAAANPAYAEIVHRARTVFPRRPSLELK